MSDDNASLSATKSRQCCKSIPSSKNGRKRNKERKKKKRRKKKKENKRKGREKKNWEEEEEEGRSLKFMFPSAGALSEGAMREGFAPRRTRAARFRKRLPLISLSFVRSLTRLGTRLEGLLVRRGEKRREKGEKRKRNEERKKKRGSERGGEGQATLLLSTWRELALCLVKIVSGTREKAHNICKRPVQPDCRALSECVNPR